MRTTIIGIMGGIFLVWYSITQSSQGNISYIDNLGVLIVFGGTLCSGILTYGVTKLIGVFTFTINVFKNHSYPQDQVVQSLYQLLEKIQKNPHAVSAASKDDEFHPFIRDGLRLINNEVEADRMEDLLMTALQKRNLSQLASIDVIRTLSKYPPAFGMIGTVIGLVALLTSIGTDNASTTIGPSMATALLTTLYGLLISQLILIPLGDNLSARLNQDLQLRTIIFEVMILIRKNEDPMMIKEQVMAHLLPGQKEAFLAKKLKAVA